MNFQGIKVEESSPKIPTSAHQSLTTPAETQALIITATTQTHTHTFFNHFPEQITVWNKSGKVHTEY